MKQSKTSNRYSKVLDSFSDPAIAKNLLERIHYHSKPATIMEVCGTHTMALFRTGIRGCLPENINLVSGPGCPVCVTPVETVEKAIGIACRKDTELFCFGDMMKVPGISGTLENARAAKNASVKIMYSPLEGLEKAVKEPSKKIVLFGIGFETTIPVFASVLLRAKEKKIKNLFLIPAFKLVPPALDALLCSGETKIDGFLLPGHVSSIIGEKAYGFIPERYHIPGVITGFEPVDLLEGILVLIEMISEKKPAIANEYSRFVYKEGNTKALKTIKTVFTETDSIWRGLGEIKKSGLSLKGDFKDFDAEQLVDFEIPESKEPAGCICGEVIKGNRKPAHCRLFGKACTPSDPVGPCMVSSEGTCAAYYKYGKI